MGIEGDVVSYLYEIVRTTSPFPHSRKDRKENYLQLMVDQCAGQIGHEHNSLLFYLSLSPPPFIFFLIGGGGEEGKFCPTLHLRHEGLNFPSQSTMDVGIGRL